MRIKDSFYQEAYNPHYRKLKNTISEKHTYYNLYKFHPFSLESKKALKI